VQQLGLRFNSIGDAKDRGIAASPDRCTGINFASDPLSIGVSDSLYVRIR
jgi:hypothetical protein